MGGGMSKLSISRVVLVAFALVVVSAASSAAQAVDVGQKVYAAQKCSICHSVAGVGNKKGPMEDAAAKLSADEIRLWVTDAPAMAAKTKAARKPPMKAYMLPKEELDGLVAYIQSLKK
jgi:mono/diheme cytochrome c family protein